MKLVLLFSLVMAATGLNAASPSHSASLNVGGEILYFGKDFPYTQQYACGAVATYAEKETGANFGHFTLEFTHDATIKGENYTRPSAPADRSYYAIRTTQAIDVYLNGHAITVLPAGKEDSPEKWLARIYADGNVNIHGGSINAEGMGALDVQQGYIGSYNSVSIHGAIVDISEGNDETEVAAIDPGHGSLTISGSCISISGYSKLICAPQGFSCTGSMLDLVSRESSHGDSVSDTAVVEDGTYILPGKGISLLGSVVSIVSEHPGLSGIRPRGELLVEDSCVAIVSDRSCFRLDNYGAGSTARRTFRNDRISAISMTGNVFVGTDGDSETHMTTFGSGEYVFGSSGNKQGGNPMDDSEYYLNLEGKIAALVSGRIEIDGGNLEICAPNAYGCDTHEFTMKNGSLKMVDSIDHSRAVHAILDETVVKETVSANSQFSGWTVEHSQMLKNMLDHLDAASVGAFAGRAGGVIQTERFCQTGGRIDEGTALYGCYVDYSGSPLNPQWITPVFTGGSLKMDFRYFYNKYGASEYRALAPTNALGQTLVRVDYEPYWIVDSTSQTQTIGEALGVPGVEWGSCDTKYTLKIDRDWTCDGNGSVRTDDMSFQAERRCGISLKVKGPTSMKFSYSKSFSAATFVVDCGSDFLYKDDMPGIKTEWKQVILDIPAGEQTVYIYARPGYFFFNEENEYNGFWIDDLQFGDFEHEKVYLIDYDQGPGAELTTSAAQARPYSNPLTYTASDLPLVLADAKPLKTGYTFVGWSMNGKMVTGIPKGTTENIQLVAVWEYEGGSDLRPDDPPLTDPAIECNIKAEYRTKADVGVIPVEVVNVKEAVKIAVKGLPSGVKFTAKDVVDRKTKSVTVPANSIYGAPTKSGVYAATVTVTPTDRKSKMTPLVKTLTFVVRNAGEHIVRVECDAAQGSVKGMGVYAKGKKVTLKATAAKGWVFSGWYNGDELVSRLASYALTMPEEDVNLTAQFVTAEADAKSVALSVMAGETDIVQAKSITVKQGMYVEWPVAASALSATTVKVSGLPSGLKFTAKDVKATKTSAAVPANTIYGTPKTASKVDKNGKVTPSKVKVVVTTAGKSKQEYVFNVTVRGIPAEGTFNGGGENGLVTLTVAKTGKISGKYLADGKTWTLSAAGFDTWDDDGRMTATLTAKSGKEVKTVGLTYEDGHICASLTSGRDSASPLFEAWRNEWKAEPQKALATKLKGQKVQVGEVLLTVGANGAVTAKGTFVTGFDEKKQKDITYSASCSTVLIPTAKDGWYSVYLYFPPKTGKFDGFTDVVEIGLDEGQ